MADWVEGKKNLKMINWKFVIRHSTFTLEALIFRYFKTSQSYEKFIKYKDLFIQYVAHLVTFLFEKQERRQRVTFDEQLNNIGACPLFTFLSDITWL